MPKGSTLEKWFDRLARNKMEGPAVATAGMAVGLIVMTAGLVPWKQPVGDIVLGIGLTQVGASSLLFVAFAALQFYKTLCPARRARPAESGPGSIRSRSPSRRRSRQARNL